MTNLIIIDGKNALYRFGYAHKYLIDTQGRPTGVAYGLTGELLRFKQKHSPCRYVVVWDGAGTRLKGWRVAIYPQYKGNRVIMAAASDEEKEAAEMRKKVLDQQPVAQALFEILNIPQIEVPELEADDAIAMVSMVAIRNGYQPIIYSTDKDFCQLLHDGVKLLRGNEFETSDSIFKNFRCAVHNVLAVRAFTGDNSDGIESVYAGIGPVRAAKFVLAGLNPSIPFEQQSPKLQATFSALKSKWHLVQRNYSIMSLIRRFDDPRLTDFQKASLKAQIPLAFHHPKKIDYGKLVAFLGAYDLNEAMKMRQELAHLHLP